jgi:hypothetical protein
MSRSVELSDNTGCEPKNTTHPRGMPARPGCWATASSRWRVPTCNAQNQAHLPETVSRAKVPSSYLEV